MDTKQAIRAAHNTADLVVNSYLDDFPEDQWNRRPHENCNDLNWQFGHLVQAEAEMIGGSLDLPYPLPEGFADRYSREAQHTMETRLPPAELRALQKQVRARTLEILEQIPMETLDQAGPESMQAYCPTVGDAFLLNASHWLMHTGQWVILRRTAELPIVI